MTHTPHPRNRRRQAKADLVPQAMVDLLEKFIVEHPTSLGIEASAKQDEPIPSVRCLPGVSKAHRRCGSLPTPRASSPPRPRSWASTHPSLRRTRNGGVGPRVRTPERPPWYPAHGAITVSSRSANFPETRLPSDSLFAAGEQGRGLAEDRAEHGHGHDPDAGRDTLPHPVPLQASMEWAPLPALPTPDLGVSQVPEQGRASRT